MESVELNFEAIDVLRDIGKRLGKSGYLNDLLGMFEKQSDGILDEIAVSLEKRDLVEVRHLTHKLKGGSQSLGAKTLALNCQDLQQLCEVDAKNVEGAQKIFSELKGCYKLTIKELSLLN